MHVSTAQDICDGGGSCRHRQVPRVCSQESRTDCYASECNDLPCFISQRTSPRERANERTALLRKLVIKERRRTRGASYVTPLSLRPRPSPPRPAPVRPSPSESPKRISGRIFGPKLGRIFGPKLGRILGRNCFGTNYGFRLPNL